MLIITGSFPAKRTASTVAAAAKSEEYQPAIHKHIVVSVIHGVLA